ncbi:UPF0496 protein 4-like [Malania oleifera]|uniref:UPF0496 protein 4-like n=1 Tax=Malania oleifera TaxID=397392 RepID=UPI0025AE7EAB|nr:UPF0496 protein 4-like [Malania oleifera]
MFLGEISNFPSFSPFRVTKKPSLPKNFDLIARSFDENFLRRIQSLASDSNPPSFSLLWLSLAVDFLSSTHAEAQTLISDLKLSSLDDSLARYLDESVKLLDVCNSISAEIERLRQRRLLINFILHLFKIPGDSARIPAPDRLRRARESLVDSENSPRGFQMSMEVLVRDLEANLRDMPRGKISSVRKLVRRTICAVELVTVFVSGIVASALFGLPELVEVRVPAEFLWADSLNNLESAIRSELDSNRAPKGPVLREIADVDLCVRRLGDAIDEVAGGDDGKREELSNAVKELEVATEAFSVGLDGLYNGVNGTFQTVLCSRNGVMGKLVKHEKVETKREVKYKTSIF